MAPLPKSRAQLLDGEVLLLLEKGKDHAALRLDPPRATVPAKRLRARRRLTLAALTPKRAAAALWLMPSDTAYRTRIRRSRESALDIAAGLPSPADILNHNSQAL